MAKLLYNKTEASQLTAEERQHIITLSSIAGAVAGGVTSQTSNQSNTTPNTVQNAALGSEIGKSAVENNFFSTILNNPQVDWSAIAEGEEAKKRVEKETIEYIKKEHPILHKTAEDMVYFISSAGELIYLSREIVIEVAPILLAPELVAGKYAYKTVAGAATGAASNIAAQRVSGQNFNWYELGGATLSGAVSPYLKTSDLIRFNMGVGMAAGLASGEDPIQGAVLSGIASHTSSKISNPLWSVIISESIQKYPNIKDEIRKKFTQENEDK